MIVRHLSINTPFSVLFCAQAPQVVPISLNPENIGFLTNQSDILVTQFQGEEFQNVLYRGFTFVLFLKDIRDMNECIAQILPRRTNVLEIQQPLVPYGFLHNYAATYDTPLENLDLGRRHSAIVARSHQVAIQHALVPANIQGRTRTTHFVFPANVELSEIPFGNDSQLVGSRSNILAPVRVAWTSATLTWKVTYTLRNREVLVERIHGNNARERAEADAAAMFG